MPSTTPCSLEEVSDELRSGPLPRVAKFNWLAAGKGSFVVRREEDIQKAVEGLGELSGSKPSGPYLVQEFIEGEEMSFFVATDGKDAVFLGSAADYKELYPDGPMTGGMGGYAPNPRLTAELYDQIMREVVYPTIAQMAEDGHTYRGVLYFQLMITPDNDVYVIEINVRFGDPEMQLLAPLYEGDLAEVLYATTLDGVLKNYSVALDQDMCSVGVVLASAGYPAGSSKGDIITGVEIAEGDEEDGEVLIFQAGTALNGLGELVTAGGRVMAAVAVSSDWMSAKAMADATAEIVDFSGKQYRPDIAERLL